MFVKQKNMLFSYFFCEHQAIKAGARMQFLFILIDFWHQIGSYFGASLSLLDVDSDGDSDFLLVGAPLFYQSQPRAEGRLYVYTLSEQVHTDS